MKIFSWISKHIFLILTLALLVFIPLYPKKPLLDIQHTWVYIRLEDFLVAFAVLWWIIALIRKKVSLRTPLTFPILLFWIVAGLSTLHGVLLIFPTLSNVFSNVAMLSFLRKIEYLFLFFIAYTAIKEKKYVYYIIPTLVMVLLLVIGYGFGQKFFGFPAYLTMNEEFAKGIPIQLSQLSRIPSTFAGHYDLAAYLVLIIPIVVSLMLGIKNWLLKIFLLCTASAGFILLLMTVSRVSFFVLLLSLILLLFLQKRKMLIVSLLVICLAILSFFPTLMQRFGSTVTQIDVLVNAKTGNAIGKVKEVPASYFQNKEITRELAQNEQDSKLASASGVVLFSLIPDPAVVVTEPNASTGESLPQGTSYINLPLSPVVKKVNNYFYEKSKDQNGIQTTQIFMYDGEFLVKRAKAYDLSFTTRFQGEWPRTLDAFRRNILLGSGSGSVSLAVDNNYLRILGESGLLGFFSFFSIFFVAGIYVKRILPRVDSIVTRSLVLGFVAGTFGLLLNGVFIDVFEASKIAFMYWLLMGIILGTLDLYRKEEINLWDEFLKLLSYPVTAVVFLFVTTVTFFSSALDYYFVGDDFTWLRWASDCRNHVASGLVQCEPLSTFLQYFTQSDGFFYRPGTKIYFSLMYSAFWFNQTMYHLVSIGIHFIVSVLVFLIAKRVLKNHFLAVGAGFLFLILSGHSETVFWTAATGHLFNVAFILLSLLFFIFWKEKKKIMYLILSICSIFLSLLFHELGIVAPLLIILYDVVYGGNILFRKLDIKNIHLHLFVALPILPYLILRFGAGSHWFNGDYSYNLFKLPYNIIGNTLGYLMLAVVGPESSSLYQSLRNVSKEHLLLALILSVVVGVLILYVYKKYIRFMVLEDKKIVVFGTLFFMISLIPFLGLGNITFRYNYLSSVGFVILVVFFLQKLFIFLRAISDRKIASAGMFIIILIFSANHLFQLQKLSIDWDGAGETSKKFLVSLNHIYSVGWKTESIKLYFVDVPIRHGDAWVFPVGLSDAIWAVFQNKNMSIYQSPSVEVALDGIQDSSTEKVYLFDETGNITEKIRLTR